MALMESGHLLMVTVVIVLIVSVGLTDAHICVISPRQRGDFDISQPGSKACTRHQGPCGGQAAETPKVAYTAGRTALIRYQQNLNHYEVGLPGYMDISLAPNVNSTDFRTLAVIGDTYEHVQWNQRNYTMAVVMPNISCDHCVLRMRYVSHKEGEHIFYQCSDIAVRKSNTSSTRVFDHESLTQDDRDNIPASLKRTMSLQHTNSITNTMMKSSTKSAMNDIEVGYSDPSLFGISWNPRQTKGGHLVEIDRTTGEINPTLGLYFGMGPSIQYGTPSPTAQSDKFVMDQITCYSREIPYLFLLEHRNGGMDDRPNKILWIDMEANAIAGEYEIESLDPDVHISTLNAYQRTNFLTFEMKPTPSSQGNFTLMFGTLDYMGNHQTLYTEPTPEALYVNFLFSTVDLKRQMQYVLLGDENSVLSLSARIHSFNFTTRNKVQITEVDVSQYTINAIQAYEKTGQLLAVSPGLFPQQYPPWYLVEVNATTGKIKPLFQIASSGMFAPYYGGAVVNIDHARGLMYYVFRVADSIANIIATINIQTQEVSFSQLTSLQFVHNIAYYDPYAPGL